MPRCCYRPLGLVEFTDRTEYGWSYRYMSQQIGKLCRSRNQNEREEFPISEFLSAHQKIVRVELLCE
jgi:hypothetical protein